jgi:hypothetical protein
VTWETALFIAGLTAEAGLLGLLISRRVYRILPVFCAYILWSLISDPGAYLLSRLFPPSDLHPLSDLHIYLAAAIIDAVFMFGVLIELSMSVLRPARAVLPRFAFVAVAIIIALICLAIWPFAKSTGFDQLHPESRIMIHLEQTFAAMRVLFFLTLAGCSQLLALGWRDRELQIATGFGVFSLASLSVSIFHASQGIGANPALANQYHLLDLIVPAIYTGSIVYWMICFAQEVPERREFTPQMQNFLLAVAGNARASRISLTRSDVEKVGKR